MSLYPRPCPAAASLARSSSISTLPPTKYRLLPPTASGSARSTAPAETLHTPLSLPVQDGAAVGVEDLAREEGAVRRGQEDIGRGDLAWVAGALHACVYVRACVRLLVILWPVAWSPRTHTCTHTHLHWHLGPKAFDAALVLEGGGDERRPDWPRRDSIDADLAVMQLQGVRVCFSQCAPGPIARSAQPALPAAKASA